MNLKLEVHFRGEFQHCITIFPEFNPKLVINLDNYYDCKSREFSMKPEIEDGNPGVDERLVYKNVKGSLDLSDAKIRESYHTKYYARNKMLNNTSLALTSSIEKLQNEEKKRLPMDSYILIEVHAVHRNNMQYPCYVMVGALKTNLFDLYKKVHSHDNKNGKVHVKEVMISANNEMIGTVVFKIHKKNDFTLKDGYYWENTRSSKPSQWEKDNRDATLSHAQTVFNWFKRFKFPIVLSKRINDYFNFSVYGKSLPGSYLTCGYPKTNPLYWQNLFHYSMIRYLVRNQKIKLHKYDLNGLKSNSKKIPITRSFLKREFNKLHKDKLAILGEMLFILPTSLSYIGDHVITNKTGEKIPVEDFNSPFQTKSGDCEGMIFLFINVSLDFAWTIFKMYEALVNCKIDPKIYPILYELQLIAKCMFPMLCLDRVTSKSVEDTRSSPGEGVSAHMNVMMMSMDQFLNAIMLTKKHDSDDISQMIRAIKKEKKKLNETYKLLENYGENHPAKNIKARLIRTGTKKKIKKWDYNTVLEGTGEFNVLDKKNKTEKEDIYIEKNMPVTVHLGKMIYHDKDDKIQFYTHNMIGMSPHFLVHHNIGATQWFWTYSKQNDGNIILKKSTQYGVKYRDFVEGNKYIKLVPTPFMTRKEIEVLYSTAKLRPRIPDLMISNTFRKDVLRIGDKIKPLASIPKPLLFKDNYIPFEYDESLGKYTPIQFDIGSGEWRFRNGSDLIGKNVDSKTKPIMHNETMNIYMMKAVMKQLRKAKKEIESEKSGIKEDMDIVYQIYNTQPRHFLYEKFVTDIIKGFRDKERVKYFDYYIENISGDINNVVLCLGIKKIK